MKLLELVRGRARAYHLVFEKVTGGGYVVTAHGETLKVTLERAHVAIECRLRTLIAQGKEVPEGDGWFEQPAIL